MHERGQRVGVVRAGVIEACRKCAGLRVALPVGDLGLAACRTCWCRGRDRRAAVPSDRRSPRPPPRSRPRPSRAAPGGCCDSRSVAAARAAARHRPRGPRRCASRRVHRLEGAGRKSAALLAQRFECRRKTAADAARRGEMARTRGVMARALPGFRHQRGPQGDGCQSPAAVTASSRRGNTSRITGTPLPRERRMSVVQQQDVACAEIARQLAEAPPPHWRSPYRSRAASSSRAAGRVDSTPDRGRDCAVPPARERRAGAGRW